MPDAKTEPLTPRSRLAVLLATVWVGLFFVWFFSLDFDSGAKAKFSRWQLWSFVHELADFIDPPAPQPGAAVSRELFHSGWKYFPQRLDLPAVSVTILAGAWGAGHLILRGVRPPLPAKCVEQTVFAFGLGLSALSLATLLAGLLGALSRPLLGSLLALAFAAELTLRFVRLLSPPAASGGSNAPRTPFEPERRWQPLSPGHWLALATLAPFLVATLLGALLPPTDFDVKAYHFEGPKEFFQAGRISFLEHNVYTNFPFGTEMLTLLAMVLEGDWYRGALAGNCLLMFFGPLTALTLFAAGRRWFGTTAGVIAAIIFLSTPWTYRISTIAYAEGGLCFFLFAALTALMMAVDRLGAVSANGAPVDKSTERAAGWAPPDRVVPAESAVSAGQSEIGSKALPEIRPKSPGEGERRTSQPVIQRGVARAFLLAGLLAGSAMACKYPGFVSVVIPLFAISAWTALRRLGKPGWVLPGAFVLGTALTVGPWLVRNTIETGNPVYPLAWRVFGGRDWDAADDAKWRNGHRPPTYSLSSLAGLAIDVAARSNWDSPLLFALAPLALVAFVARKRAGWLWAYVGWLFLACWLFTHRIDRFWVPLLPVVALLAGAGAAWLWESLKNGLVRSQSGISHRRSVKRGWRLADIALGRIAFIIPLVVAAVFNLELIVGTPGFCGYNDYLRDLDEASRFTAQLTAPELVWLNTNLPSGSKVLVVGDGAMFEARIPVVYNTVFDRSIFESWCAARPGVDAAVSGLRDAASIQKKFADEGITHVYVNWNWILRYRSPGNYGYTDFVTPERFAEVQRMGILGPALQIANSSKPVEEIDSTWLPELESWGKLLITGAGDRREFITFQVFPVGG